VHDAFPTHGPYYSKAEIERDPDLPEDLRERFLQDYNKAINNVEEVDEAGNVIKYENMLQKTFDGQSISTLMHQIDMHEAMGRLSPEIFKLLIEKHYRKLTADEVKLMQNGKVVNNPKKTVTASTNSYHKLSENLIDRNDASILFIPDGVREQGGDAIKAYIKETHEKMLGFYLEIHKLRKQIQDLKEVGIDSSDLYKEIQDITFQIHSYYRPMLGREVLHNLLNSMEFYQIDQLMDTEASKNATILPVDYFAEAARPDRKYINLGLSSLEVQNKFKYLQVETSGIKDVAKISNQSKGLIAADIINLMEIAEASGRPITETDRLAISNVANVLVDYQKTLRGLAESNLTNLRTMLRKGGDFEIGKVFNLIRESLESQGAPTSTLKLFDVNPDGKPVHSPNLPGIRNTLEFYFFSQYSKHITDEKGSGFKNIHISSLGYDIIVDQDNKVILTSDYRRNPAKYPGARSRKLGVETVVNKDGTTTYFVECIMPEPYFRDNAHKKFYMEKLNKMFAARIPTEDKRSMIALKVVDFMDSSNLNGVIVPHFIHMLSGSDFDVDALYGQTYAHYFNADGTPSLYGDYSAYASENEGKYVEFVEYMANDKDIKVAVKAENDRLDAISDEDFNVYDSVKTFVSYISPRLQNDIPTLRKYEAILKVFEKYGLPVSLEAFNATPAYSQSVRPIYQNKNLAAKLDIISNQAVFKFLYINERSSTERAEQSLDEFGIPLESKAGKFNKYTIDGVIAVKKTNSMNKDGISITANISKFLSLASQYALELKPSEVIWAFQKATALDKDGNFKLISESYSKFGTLNTEGKRVMEIIGNILGMFADGAKKPIPSALYMNEENAGVTLAMIGVGLSPDFALGFNFIPEIRNAISEVMASKNAISEQTGNSLIFLSSEVKNELRDLIYKNQTEFDQLKELGVISSGSTATFVTVQNKNIVLEFTSPKQNKTKLDLNKLDNNTLTTKEIGYNMSAVIKAGTKNAAGEESTENVIIALTETQQKMILLQMYAAQSQQTFALRRAGSVPNLFKALTPQFTNFDRLVANIADLKENTERNIFTEESTNRMFADNQVWAVLYESMLDLNDQASKLFLERTPFFAPIKKAFEDVFTNHSQIAKIITSFVALKKYQMSMPGSRSSKIEAMNELIAQDDKNLVQTFTAEYWFTNTLAEELEEMQKKYPENKFLQILRAEKTENTAYTASGKPVSEKMLKMINKSKLSGKAAEEVVDDASFLMYEENMFVKKLFYHELAKTGMQQKSGSFLQFLPADLLVPISEYINDFVTKLENTKGNRYELVNAIKDFMGPEYTQEDVYALFNELFIQMAHAAKTEAGNTKIKGVKAFQFKDTSTLMKSFKFDKENATQKRAVAIETVKHFIGQGPAGDSTSYTPKSINPDTKKADEVITINMNVPGPAISQATKATMLELGKAVGIKGAFGNPDNYTFPLMFSMDSNTYLLQGVDNEIDNKNFGESMIKSIVGTGQYKTTGKIARYTLIPKELSAGTLSPIGFTKEASQEYMDLINKKARLSVEPVVSEVKPVQSVQGKTENPLVEIGVKPTDMSGNAAKDIQMADEATQFIGFQSGNATISSTSTYRLAWGNNANTGQYKASDVIMVSGSGLWRGVTQEQIKETLSTRYKPLLDKAIEAGAYFVVGNQYSKGNLSDQLISEYLKKRGYTEQKLNGYSRYSLTAQSQVKTTPATQPSTSVESKRTFKDEEYHQAYIKGGLAAVQELIQKNKQKEMSAAKQLSKEVDMLTEFENLNNKPNKTNSENDRLIELYTMLKNSKELDFEYSLNQLGLSTQQPETQREYTPENITSLKPNEVFVFGANTVGGHGGGTAGLAQRGTTSSNYTALPVGTKGKWSEYGVVDKLMQGTEGKSFGIVTKAATISGTSLKIGAKRSVSLSRIESSINALIKTANENPSLKFLVTKFGTNMAGFSEQEMKSLLENKTLPDNIILPKEFEVRTTVQPSATAEIFEDAPAEVEQTEVAEPQFGSDGSMDMSSMLREARKEREAKANAEAASTTTTTTKLSTPQKPIHIYSDGSDIKGTGKIGFGAVFEYGGIMYDLSGTEESPEVKRLAEIHPDAKFSNPTMEMMALVSVLNTFKNKAEHIVINQDYTGAVNYDGLWQKAEGSAQRQPKPWKAKEAYIKTLVNAGVKIIEQIESNGGSVQINWVKGHSGNRMNDLADTAAKSREIFNNMTKAYENADKTQVDMKNLNLTPQVIDALYEQGRKSLSKQEFAKAAADMVAKLRSTMTPNQILEKINCL
jgi:ribonuclease HI